VGAFENANDATFRAVAAFGPGVTFVPGDPRHDLVAMHRGARVFRGDKEILLAGFFARQEGEAGLVDRDRAGNQVRFRRQDVTVLANARDLAVAFHLAQDSVQIHPDAALAAERLAQLDIVERPVIWRAQQIEDLFAQLGGVVLHEVCTLRANCPERYNKSRSVIFSVMRWKIAGQTLDLSTGAMIMGVLNVTPDSFSDGGEFFSTEKAVEQAKQMALEGAQIIDIGGESTRPGAAAVSADEEVARVIPVIEELRESVRSFLSIDTSKAAVARKALDVGATIINDVTAGRSDSEMFALASERKAALILMHMQGTPRTMQAAPHYDDVVREVANFFRQQYERALECGVDAMAIAFDPGIGFGKTVEHNLTLLANLERLRVDDRPLVVGVSRKSSLGKMIGSNAMEDRLAPTIAFTALLRERGANVLRVHDVKENVAALRITEALLETTKP
jgi:dihydropteroate synthase